MNWFWLNMPLCAVFFLTTAGIPLWMVLRRPDTAPDGHAAAATEAIPQPREVTVLADRTPVRQPARSAA
jgi:hypothetical protein